MHRSVANQRVWNRRRDESGIAMITSLLVMMVCVILVAAVTQLAIHSTQRSGLSRNRSAALHAAEAGIEAALSSLSANSACPTPGSEVALPDQNLPHESYRILAPVSCSAGGNAVIAAVGYVPNATNPVATTTLVAHVNRGQGAPVSGTNAAGVQACAVAAQCGYVFPDALFSGGAITAATPNTLSAYGAGGTVPNIVGHGPVSIAGSQLDGLVHAWGLITLNVATVGGEVVGNGVTINGGTVQGGSGGVVSGDLVGGPANSGNLTLSSTTVNGTAKYSGPTYTNSGSTITAGPASHVVTTLPPERLMPTFTDNSADMQTILGVGAPSSSCPGTGTGSYYDIPVNVACTYNPPTINGTVVLVVHGGLLTVTVPQTTTGGQLYVISAGGLADSLVLNGTNSTLRVFAFTDGPLTINGNNGGISGQLLGNSIATSSPTTLTFAPPSIPVPDFAFNSTQTAPTGIGYAASIAFQYQCPGTTPC